MAFNPNSALLFLLSLIFSANKNYDKTRSSINSDPPSDPPGGGGLGALLSSIPGLIFGSNSGNSSSGSSGSSAPSNLAGFINPLLNSLKPGGNPSSTGGGSISQDSTNFNPMSLLNGIKIPSGGSSGNPSGSSKSSGNSSTSKPSGSTGGSKGSDNPFANIINPLLNNLSSGGNSSASGAGNAQFDPLNLLNGIKIPSSGSSGSSSASKSSGSSGSSKAGDNPVAGIVNPLLNNLNTSSNSGGGTPQGNPMDLLKGIKIPSGGNAGSSSGGTPSFDPVGLINSIMSGGGIPSSAPISPPGVASASAPDSLSGVSPNNTALSTNPPRPDNNAASVVSTSNSPSGSNGVKWNSFSEDSPDIVTEIRPDDIITSEPKQIADNGPVGQLPEPKQTKDMSEIKALPPGTDESSEKNLLAAPNEYEVIYLPPAKDDIDTTDISYPSESEETKVHESIPQNDESQDIKDFHSLGKELLESTVSIEEKLSPFLNEQINKINNMIDILNEKAEDTDIKGIISILNTVNNDMENTLSILSKLNSNIGELVSLGIKFMDLNYTDILNLADSVNETSDTNKNKLD